MKLIITASLLGLVAVTAGAQAIYKSVDEEGLVSYADRPGEMKQPETLDLEWSRTDNAAVSAEVTKAAGSFAEKNATSRKLTKEQALKQEATANLAAERQSSCEEARDRLDRYTISRRIYRQLPDGEREYLNDDELVQARVDAQLSVDERCSG